MVNMFMQIFDKKGKQANLCLLISGLKIIDHFLFLFRRIIHLKVKISYFVQNGFYYHLDFGITISYNLIQQTNNKKQRLCCPINQFIIWFLNFQNQLSILLNYECKLYLSNLNRIFIKKDQQNKEYIRS
ncbi:unnamed protein product [Paramecium sonneborni]|uniref:Uncharacterized protein n=1 Tax=Paramecium sonneborni TaxID=65129 RepID=A0A8S1KS32_9CILI|nr:unnamed protein product [Paramecium sonneborni]